MERIFQGAREMEETFVQAMIEDEAFESEARVSVKPLTKEEKDARMAASVQKLREANDRFEKQLRMDPDVVDHHKTAEAEKALPKE